MKRPHPLRAAKLGLLVVQQGWRLTGGRCEMCGDPMIEKQGEVICLSEFAKRMGV